MNDTVAPVETTETAPEAPAKVARTPRKRGEKKAKVDGRKRGEKKAKAVKVVKKAKKDAPKVAGFDRDAEEKALIARYKDQDIVPGSLRDVTGKGEFAQKRSIEILCKRCTEEGTETKRRIATSDLHQVSNCDPCVKAIRLERRKDARSAARKKKGLPPLKKAADDE